MAVVRLLCPLVLLLAVLAPARAAEAVPEGTWKVS